MGRRPDGNGALAKRYGLKNHVKNTGGGSWHKAWWRHDGRSPLYLVTRKSVDGYWIMRFSGGDESFPHGPFKKFKEAAALYITLLEMA